MTNRTQTDIRYLFLIDNRLWLVETFFTINLNLEIKKCFFFKKNFFQRILDIFEDMQEDMKYYITLDV